MAPPMANNKRKRGGQPTTTSATDDASSHYPQQLRSKRAATMTQQEPGQEQNEPETIENPRPRKRGRTDSAKNGTKADKAVAAVPGPAKSGRKTRSSLEKQEDAAEEGDGEVEAAGGARRRGRPKRTTAEEPRGQEESDTVPSRGKKRGRQSLAEISVSRVQNGAGSNAASDQNQHVKKKRGRSSLKERDTGENSDRPTPSRRPRTSDGGQQASKAGKNKKRPHPSDISPQNILKNRRPRLSSASPATITSPAGTKRPRRGSNEGPTVSAAKSKTKPKYRSLVPRERHIPRSVIASKWNPLDEDAIQAVTALLADAERPVLYRLRDRDNRREQAAQILALISRRVLNKLVKGMPFPPATGSSTRAHRDGVGGGHEDDLDFERVVDSLETLKTQIDPVLHSVALLRREKAREEAALERDYVALQTLETNARAEARGWKEGAKRIHALVPELVPQGGPEGRQDAYKDLELVPLGQDPVGNIFKDIKDEELTSLSRQVGNHMESMRGNLQQVGGVVEEIVRSKAALREVLHRALGPEQFEQVVLG